MPENKTFPKDPTATMQAGAPTPAATKSKAGKSKSKSAKPRKVRIPKVKDNREINLLAAHKAELKAFLETQSAARKNLRKAIYLETHPPKPSRVDRMLSKLTPEEQQVALDKIKANMVAP